MAGKLKPRRGSPAHRPARSRRGQRVLSPTSTRFRVYWRARRARAIDLHSSPVSCRPCASRFSSSCVDPFADAELDVLRIGVQAHAAGALQRLEGADDRRQFHAVVGRQAFAAVNFAGAARRKKKRAPATDARVALAGAVGINVDDVRDP